MEACFTVEGLESVEVAEFTPAKARERKVANPGGPEPRGLASSISRATESRVRDLADLPFATIPTASELGGVLRVVLDAIRLIHARGFWLEIVTLLIPGFNDSAEEIRDIAQFLRSVSPDIPWHVTAFHPDYKMTDRGPTPARTLVRAAEVGRAEGLRYVYAGNVPAAVGPFENTWCPGCGALLVERVGYRILQNRLTLSCASCPECSTAIPGVWSRG